MWRTDRQNRINKKTLIENAKGEYSRDQFFTDEQKKKNIFVKKFLRHLIDKIREDCDITQLEAIAKIAEMDLEIDYK